MDRLEQHRIALRQAFDDGDAPGGAERHVGGVDGVVGAVDQRHLDVDHGEAERPVLERVDDALFHRRNVVARHHAAGDAVLELEARVARQRLDLQHHVAELAVAAGLLLVPAALRDRLADGLAVADGRRPGRHRHLIAVRQPLGGDAQVHLALAPDHHLVAFRIVHDGERGVLVGELGEGGAELDVVLALLGLHGGGEHRRIGLNGDQRGVRLLAARQRVAGSGAVELAEGDGVAGARLGALVEVLTHDLEHAGDAAGFLVRRIEGGAVAGLPGEQARHRHLAAMGGVEGLEHQRHRVAAGLDAEPRRGLGDARRLVAQRLQEPQHAVRAGGDAEQHRADLALAQLLGQIVEHLVARRLDVLEQLLHQLVVVVGERLQHREARFLLAARILALELDDLGGGVLLVDIGALQREIDEAGDDVAVPDRNLPQQQRHARGRLQQLDGLAHALVGLVDLVEVEEVRDVLVFQLAQDQLQLRHFLFVGLADDDRGVDCRQHRAHVVDEFDRARAVDEGVAVAHEGGGGDRSLDAHLVMAGFLAGVADRGARFHRALALDRAGAGEDGLEKGCLAALERAHQRDAPGTLVFIAIGTRAVLSHEYLPCAGREVGPSRPCHDIVAAAGRTGKPGIGRFLA